MNTAGQHSISGFRATGLSPCNPQVVSKRLPNTEANKAAIGRCLHSSPIKLLQEQREIRDPTLKKKTRKKLNLVCGWFRSMTKAKRLQLRTQQILNNL